MGKYMIHESVLLPYDANQHQVVLTFFVYVWDVTCIILCYYCNCFGMRLCSDIIIVTIPLFAKIFLAKGLHVDILYAVFTM